METFDKKVVSQIKKDLRELRQYYVQDINGAIAALGRQKTIDGVMSVKRDLIVNMLNNVPITGPYCYFCVWHNAQHRPEKVWCGSCSYGKAHGRCMYGSDDNTWGQINQAISKAQSIVIKSYWRGDELDA